MSVPFVEIEGLVASYAKRQVLRDVNLTLDKGEILGIIGRSGSGKSSLLRALVGLMNHDAGSVRINGLRINYSDPKSLATVRSRVAIVFQQFNLFHNMTVLRNVTLAPCLVKKRERRQVERDAIELLTKVGLGDRLQSYPDELSGGQQQRVAIARALAMKPDILLLDEVTSALDPELVSEVLDTVRILAREGIAMIIVSHEIEFIREVSSKVIMFDDGRIISSGISPQFFMVPDDQARQFLASTGRRLIYEPASPAS